MNGVNETIGSITHSRGSGRSAQPCPATLGCLSQLCPCSGGGGGVLGHQLGDFTNEVGLLGAAFAGLAPLLQDLLQVLHLQLLQVHRGQVQLFVCKDQRKDNDATAPPVAQWWNNKTFLT